MHTIQANSPDEALARGLNYLRNEGRPVNTRNGPALRAPGPVATVYTAPQRRVIADPLRDANPIFHLFEAMWIIQGQQDVDFLAYFNKKMADYSDDGKVFHAPYGYRLRHGAHMDQLETAVRILAKNPDSRQVVLQIWDANLDLGAVSKDIPCNDMVFVEIQQGKLNIMVANRSNDIVWGAVGANIVQFSMLQEYLAARLRVEIGTYTQLSFNYHVYTDLPYYKQWLADNETVTFPKYRQAYDAQDPNDRWVPTALFTEENVLVMHEDMNNMFAAFKAFGPAWVTEFLKRPMHTAAFQDVVRPILSAHHKYKREDAEAGAAYLRRDLDKRLFKLDWHEATLEWLDRRANKKVTTK